MSPRRRPHRLLDARPRPPHLGACAPATPPLHPEVPLSIRIDVQPLSGSALVARLPARRRAPPAPSSPATPSDLRRFRARLAAVQQRFGPAERRTRRRAPSAPPHPAPPSASSASSPTGRRRRHHRPAGGPPHRPALHRPQGAHRSSASPPPWSATSASLVLPVFWIASEDHDWAEVNHAYLALRHGGAWRACSCRATPRPAVSMSAAPRCRSRGLDSVLDEVAQMVGASNHMQTTISRRFETRYRPGRTVAGAFAELDGRAAGALRRLPHRRGGPGAEARLAAGAGAGARWTRRGGGAGPGGAERGAARGGLRGAGGGAAEVRPTSSTTGERGRERLYRRGDRSGGRRHRAARSWRRRTAALAGGGAGALQPERAPAAGGGEPRSSRRWRTWAGRGS